MRTANTATSIAMLVSALNSIAMPCISAVREPRHSVFRAVAQRVLRPQRGSRSSGARQPDVGLALLHRTRRRLVAGLDPAAALGGGRELTLLRRPVLVEAVTAQQGGDLVAGQRLVLEQRGRDAVEAGALLGQDAARG